MNDSDQPQPIQTKRFDTASEFLLEISPMHANWQPDPQMWIFRGHADSAWKLLASAHRGGADAYKAFGVELPVHNGGQEASAYCEAEKELLERFKRALDRAGLPVPAPLPKIDLGSDWNSSYSETHSGGVPLLALAQHFRLPTKLLDWTRRAMIAAYFASSGVAENARDGADLAVWALRRDFLESVSNEQFDHTVLTIQTAPAASNPNLHAQQGLFTRMEERNAHCWSVDDFVKRVADDTPDQRTKDSRKSSGKDADRIARPIMRHFLLPQSESPKLLRLLANEGVTGATIYPGYDGVVRGLKEEAQWDPPRPPHWTG